MEGEGKGETLFPPTCELIGQGLNPRFVATGQISGLFGPGFKAGGKGQPSFFEDALKPVQAGGGQFGIGVDAALSAWPILGQMP